MSLEFATSDKIYPILSPYLTFHKNIPPLMGGYVNLSDIEDRLKLYIFLQKQNLIKK